MPASKTWKPTEHICQSCGRAFLTGGRGRARAHALFCSRECSGTGQVKKRVIRDLSPTAAAYTAGLLDGEGSIIVWKRKERQSAGLSVRVVIVNTYEPVMDWLESVVGGTKANKPAAYPTNFSQTPKPIWSWVVNGRNAVILLNQLLPYMVIKKERAVYAISTLT